MSRLQCLGPSVNASTVEYIHQSNNDVTMNIDAFIADCRLRGLSRRTIESYTYYSRKLATFLNGRPLSPFTVTAWANYLQGNGYKPATIGKFKTLSLSYLRW